MGEHKHWGARGGLRQAQPERDLGCSRPFALNPSERLEPPESVRTEPVEVPAPGHSPHFASCFNASLMPSLTPTSAGSAFSAAFASRSL